MLQHYVLNNFKFNINKKLITYILIYTDVINIF